MDRSARVVRERLDGDADPVLAARWLRREPQAVALAGTWLGARALLSSHALCVAPADADPFATIASSPIALPATGEQRSEPTACAGGGWLGWLGFGLAGEIEQLPPAPPRPVSLPRFQLAFHDHVVVCDEHGSWWFEALWTEERAAVLAQRRAQWRERLAAPPPAAEPFAAAPLTPVGAGLAGHRAAVAETVARIAAGDFSQANICLRLEADFSGDPIDLWVAATTASHPAYAAYVGPGAAGHAVLSLSPELFLRRAGRVVTTRPIKGTAPIGSDPALLAASAKDRAENVMIVDLMRNDIGRVCSYGTIDVPELCAVRPAAGVWHLESTVSGVLRPGVDDGELLRATFPPGSVTGAPKVQAIRTIHELEGTAREAYCGAIGLCSPIAGLELSVAIRTLETARGRLWLGVGGGVVADSSPADEVAEALTKAGGVTAAGSLELDASAPALTDRGAITAPLARDARPDPARGIIETIRVRGGEPLHWPEHAARLSASAAALGLSLPTDLDARVAAEAARRHDGGLRVAVGPAGLELATRDLPAAGVTVLEPIVVPGGLGCHKWSDRSLIDSHSAPGVTPLICDLDGSVLEAGYAAVLIITGETIVSPPLDGRRLPSVSARHTLTGAEAAGLTACVRPIALGELEQADAIVLSSSLRGPHLGVLGGRQAAEATPSIRQYRLIERVAGVPGTRQSRAR